ncbi:MAG: ribonuclease III [Anaerolineales bacterium]|nr:ribonuclease III [Anaerolineales bacterium]
MLTIQQFQNKIGYSFNDLRLLQRALTHRSYVNESPLDAVDDNERLEFLGDAILDVVTSEMLFHRYPEMPEGRMTSMRAALVRTETLGRLASYLNVGDVLRLGRGEGEHGGAFRPANLCAALEALAGAIYLDGGLGAVKKVFEPHFIPAADAILARELDRDSKSKFQEWSQANMGDTPYYQTIQEEGPDHEKTFTVQVLVGKTVYGEGKGRSKQIAAQAAAKAALERADLVDISDSDSS